MDQARYWMWIESKGSWKSDFVASVKSWEEGACAEDAAGALIWPPRSYSCTFCGREFRSAQALGGHMNAHRRDRARLRQYPSSHNEILHHHHQLEHIHIQKPCKSMAIGDPDQICTLAYNTNPSFLPRVVGNGISPLSPSRVSAPSTQVDYSKQSGVPIRVSTISDSKIAEMRNSNDDSVEHHSSVSLNLVIGPAKVETVGCKKRRTDELSLPVFTKSSPVNKLHFQSQFVGVSAGKVEDLDLELRLGDRPKI
ncbi:hypothetical protein F0562_021995 [Nyssa sinensis]|uniref:C2H2-type domain-containing protein n=1 Tax=Nyssa sinensis TaxID=561372 RepID=A0A5J5BM93_9ASTE|nr:hypothetical protein F0562_021995 [Nyssa sinensis]